MLNVFLIENWKSKEFQLFDDTSLGLIYTLAVLFLLVCTVAAARLARGIYLSIIEKDPPTFQFLLVLFIGAFQLSKCSRLDGMCAVILVNSFS